MPKYSGQLAAFLFFLAAAICFLTAALGAPEERGTRLIVGGVAALLAGTLLFFDTVVGRVKQAKPRIIPLRKSVKEET